MKQLFLVLLFSFFRASISKKIVAKAVIHFPKIFDPWAPPGVRARRGVVKFSQEYFSDPVVISGTIGGLWPGKHGLTIHEFGNLEKACNFVGGHYNPDNRTHGSLKSSQRHIGDLGNIIVGSDGKAHINITTHLVPLSGHWSIIGRALVVHSREDDLGLGKNPKSLISGNVGAAVGCGVIGIASEDFINYPKYKNALPKASVRATVLLHNARLLRSQKTQNAERNSHFAVRFEQKKAQKQSVLVRGAIRGLTPGKHGLHVYALGDLETGCDHNSGHFNPEKKQHGSRIDFERHVGDLGNVIAGKDGVAHLNFEDSGIQLVGPNSIIGRALVVHVGEDDLGQGGNAKSLTTGNAGPAVACGVIGISCRNYDPIGKRPVGHVHDATGLEKEQALDAKAKSHGIKKDEAHLVVYPTTPTTTPSTTVKPTTVVKTTAPITTTRRTTTPTATTIRTTTPTTTTRRTTTPTTTTKRTTAPTTTTSSFVEVLVLLRLERQQSHKKIKLFMTSTPSTFNSWILNTTTPTTTTATTTRRTTTPTTTATTTTTGRTTTPTTIRRTTTTPTATTATTTTTARTTPTTTITRTTTTPTATTATTTTTRTTPTTTIRRTTTTPITITRRTTESTTSTRRTSGKSVLRRHNEKPSEKSVLRRHNEQKNPHPVVAAKRTVTKHPKVVAKAVIHFPEAFHPNSPQGNPALRGVITFSQDSVRAPVLISGTLRGLKPGKHGLTIHEYGNLDKGCSAIGDHYNPTNEIHGSLTSAQRHIGDLGNIIAGADGVAHINIQTTLVPLRGYWSIIGRAVVVHSEEDDLGLAWHTQSAITGNSGPPIGCGVIGIASKHFVNRPKLKKAVPTTSVLATAVMHNTDLLQTKQTQGPNKNNHYVIRFEQLKGDRGVSVIGAITGLSPGKHAFHVHTLGDLEHGCASAGGHFNPEKRQHGARWDFDRHIGDLGNIEAVNNGVAHLRFQDSKIQLVGPHSIIGRALVVHVREDDLGLGGTAASLKTGSAGPRVACGVIGIASKYYDPVGTVPAAQNFPQVFGLPRSYNQNQQKKNQTPIRKPFKIKEHGGLSDHKNTTATKEVSAPETLPDVSATTRKQTVNKPATTTQTTLQASATKRNPVPTPGTTQRKPTTTNKPVATGQTATPERTELKLVEAAIPKAASPTTQICSIPETLTKAATVPIATTAAPETTKLIRTTQSIVLASPSNSVARETALTSVVGHIPSKSVKLQERGILHRFLNPKETHVIGPVQKENAHPVPHRRPDSIIVQPKPATIPPPKQHVATTKATTTSTTTTTTTPTERTTQPRLPTKLIKPPAVQPPTIRTIDGAPPGITPELIHQPESPKQEPPQSQHIIQQPPRQLLPQQGYRSQANAPWFSAHRNVATLYQAPPRAPYRPQTNPLWSSAQRHVPNPYRPPPQPPFRPHTAPYAAPLLEKPGCERIPFQTRCPSGYPPQKVVRWHYDEQLHACTPYTWGYCSDEHDVRFHPALTSLEACRLLCVTRNFQ